MVTRGRTAHLNRIPVLILPAIFWRRRPNVGPVLQQLEATYSRDGIILVNDAFFLRPRCCRDNWTDYSRRTSFIWNALPEADGGVA